MSDYTQVTDFSAKDSLPSGDSGKVIYGADVDTELGLISTAIASKLDKINTLTEDTAPVGTTDYLATYDASAAAYKKVLINKIGLGLGTAVLLRGNATQVLSADTITRLTNLGTETLDTGNIASSSKITLTSANQDGWYLCMGAVLFTNTAGRRRVAVTRFDSTNTAQFRVYSEVYGTTNGETLLTTWGVINLTYAASNPDYIALEAQSEPGETLASTTNHRLFAVRIA